MTISKDDETFCDTEGLLHGFALVRILSFC